MSELEIKSWGVGYTYSYPFDDIEKGFPNPRDFCLSLLIDVQEKGTEGVMSYEVIVCTPLGLLSHFNEIAKETAEDAQRSDEYIFGKGVLIVREYNIDLIEAAIRREVNNLRHYAFDVS